VPLKVASQTDGVGTLVRFNRESGEGPNTWSVEDFYAPVGVITVSRDENSRKLQRLESSFVRFLSLFVVNCSTGTQISSLVV
jgi:hypothetical protein